MTFFLIRRSARSTIGSANIQTISQMLRPEALGQRVDGQLLGLISVGLAGERLRARAAVAELVFETSLLIYSAVVQQKKRSLLDHSRNAERTLKCRFRFRSKKRSRV